MAIVPYRSKCSILFLFCIWNSIQLWMEVNRHKLFSIFCINTFPNIKSCVRSLEAPQERQKWGISAPQGREFWDFGGSGGHPSMVAGVGGSLNVPNVKQYPVCVPNVKHPLWNTGNWSHLNLKPVIETRPKTPKNGKHTGS